MKKNDRLTAQITALGSGGEGIAKPDGYALFVPYAAIGDEVRLHVLRANKAYGFAKIEELLSPSPDRVAPRCPVYEACGGCNLLHLDYEAQLVFKRQKVLDALQRIGGFADAEVMECVRGESDLRYRNKAQYPVAPSAEGVCFGFYAPHSHRVVPAEDCLLQQEESARIAAMVASWAAEHAAPYDERTQTGLLRHIYTRIGREESLLVLVTRAPLSHTESLVQALRDAFPRLVGIVENQNADASNVILGAKDRVLYGRDFIVDSIGTLSFQVHYRSFYQVNRFTTLPLYETALELCALTGTETVFDLYCGIGTISLFLAQKARRVIGVEIVEAAIGDARANAARNGIENAEFHVGAAEEVCPRLIAEGACADVVVVDPPRKGCDESLLNAICAMQPARIVYVSCDCATLARDAKRLAESGYVLSAAHPFDQFPHTAHVETVVLLSKKIG